MMWTIRAWLIRKLAGRDHVAVNLIIGVNQCALTVPPDVRFLSANCYVQGYQRGRKVS